MHVIIYRVCFLSRSTQGPPVIVHTHTMTETQANAIILRTPPVNLVTSRSKVAMACVIAKNGPGHIVRRVHRCSVMTVGAQAHLIVHQVRHRVEPIPTVHMVPT